MQIVQRAARNIGTGVSREAQSLFNAIEKIYGRTQWDNADIVVMGEVRISPPYSVDNVACMYGLSFYVDDR